MADEKQSEQRQPKVVGKASKAPDANPEKAAQQRAANQRDHARADEGKRDTVPKVAPKAPPPPMPVSMAIDDEGDEDEEVVATPAIDIHGLPITVNTAVSSGDIHDHTDAANLLDTATTRIRDKLADREAILAFPGGAGALLDLLGKVAVTHAIPDPKERSNAARAILDATYP